MTSPRKKRNNKDGISIRDQWKKNGRQGGKQWLYQVWDSAQKKYLSKAFASDPDKDSNRRRHGCAEGDAWAERRQAEMRLGQRSASRLTLYAIAEEYITMCECMGRSDGYILTLKRTQSYATDAGIKYIDDDEIVTKVLRWLRDIEARRPGQKEGTKASNRTKNQHINVLRAFGKYAVETGRIMRNPFDAIRKFPEAKNAREVYRLSELRNIVSDRHRDHPFWMYGVLLAYTGLRSSTVRKLTWSMVDWEANRIRVPAEITKTQYYVRVPIQPELRDILQQNPGVGSSTILDPNNAMVTSDRANELMIKFLTSIGVDPSKRSVHAFRHTVVSLLTASGMSHFSVMDAVGHCSTQTSKHYARGADEFREQLRKEKWHEGEFYLRRTPPGMKESESSLSVPKTGS